MKERTVRTLRVAWRTAPLAVATGALVVAGVALARPCDCAPAHGERVRGSETSYVHLTPRDHAVAHFEGAGDGNDGGICHEFDPAPCASGVTAGEDCVTPPREPVHIGMLPEKGQGA